MAEDRMESLQCYIHRFSVSLCLSEIKRIQICYNQRFLSIEKKTAVTDVVKIDTKQSNVKTFTGFQELVFYCSSMGTHVSAFYSSYTSLNQYKLDAACKKWAKIPDPCSAGYI